MPQIANFPSPYNGTANNTRARARQYDCTALRLEFLRRYGLDGAIARTIADLRWASVETELRP